jgi:prepilin-type N-terminal cleavage/methylation domain-containing protein
MFVGMRRRRGFTLLEMLIVVVLLGMAAALAAPAILHSRPERPALTRLLPSARDTAARRGETIYLRISRSGDWWMEGASSAAGGAIAAGHVSPFPGLPLTIMISPLGSCAFDPRNGSGAQPIRLDPLTCQVRS